MKERIAKARGKVVGTKQTIKALEKGEARMVFIARDADEKVVRPVIYLCRDSDIEPEYLETMYELGKAFGIKVKAATAAIIED